MNKPKPTLEKPTLVDFRTKNLSGGYCIHTTTVIQLAKVKDYTPLHTLQLLALHAGIEHLNNL